MKYRPQRGSLEESMKAVITLPSTRKALAEHLGQREDRVVVKPYGGFYYGNDPVCDERNGWNTYLVTVGGKAVGFTDGPLES